MSVVKIPLADTGNLSTTDADKETLPVQSVDTPSQSATQPQLDSASIQTAPTSSNAADKDSSASNKVIDSVQAAQPSPPPTSQSLQNSPVVKPVLDTVKSLKK